MDCTKESVMIWLIRELSQIEPISTEYLPELRTLERSLGKESDLGLRIAALHKKVQRDGAMDRDMKALALVVLEKMRLWERRMALGPKARGVKRFVLYKDGYLAEYTEDNGREKRDRFRAG